MQTGTPLSRPSQTDGLLDCYIRYSLAGFVTASITNPPKSLLRRPPWWETGPWATTNQLPENFRIKSSAQKLYSLISPLVQFVVDLVRYKNKTGFNFSLL